MENIRTLVCRNFNRLVEASPLTKKEIARQMQVDQSTLQRWKNGETFPELANIEKLAKILGVEEREFYLSEKPIVKTLPMKDVIKMIASIPDDIYLAASEIDLNHEVWGEVRRVFENAKKDGLIHVNHPPKKNHS